MNKVLRWVLTLASFPFAFAAGWGVSQLIVGMADDRCPQTSQVGGACVAAWHTDWVTGSVYAGLFVLVVAIVVIPFLLAPQFKRVVSVVGLVAAVAGPVALVYFTRWNELLVPIGFALLVGVILMGLTWRRAGHA